jgi:hypothetical protein
MKCAVLIADNEKQIFLTPENEHERKALKYITPSDNIELVTEWGNFTSEYETKNMHVAKCKAGYLRAYSDKDSLILTLTPKER